MFHPNTQRLIEDWNSRRGARPAPLRADFSPADLASLMPQLFVLDAAAGEDAFRLVGGLISDLHDDDLRAAPFRTLFGTDMLKATAALSEVRATLQPVVVAALAHTAEGYETRLEITLAPLLGDDGRVERILGLYQPTSSLARLLGKPVESLSFHGLQTAAAAEIQWSAAPARHARPALKVVAIDGRRVA